MRPRRLTARKTRAALVVLVGFVEPIGGGVAIRAEAPDEAVVECAEVTGAAFPAQPTSWFDPMGFYETGLAVVDLDVDGSLDLVVSSGNDMSPQPLAVYRSVDRQCEGTQVRPDWYSSAFEYHGDLSVGDVDGDGCPDLAVAVMFGKEDLRFRQGGVDVYLNAPREGRCGDLRRHPTFRARGFAALATAFGDVDGDGDLDLAVAAASEDDRRFRDGVAARPKPIRGRVYLNEGAPPFFDPEKVWRSSQAMYAGDVRFGDVDLDGFLDLVFAAEGLRVHFGFRSPEGQVGLDRTPGWRSGSVRELSYDSLAIARLPGAPGLAIALSSAPWSWKDLREYRFELFFPVRGDADSRKPVWSSSSTGLGSRVVFGEVTGDGRIDLVAGRWSDDGRARAAGSPVRVYAGTADGRLTRRPKDCSAAVPSAQRLELANLANPLRVVERTVQLDRSARVITLPDPLIQRVRAVTRDGRRLETKEFTWAPGASWVSFRTPVEAGERVEITYEFSDRPDLIVADWKPEGAPNLYCRGYRALREPIERREELLQ